MQRRSSTTAATATADTTANNPTGARISIQRTEISRRFRRQLIVCECIRKRKEGKRMGVVVVLLLLQADE